MLALRPDRVRGAEENFGVQDRFFPLVYGTFSKKQLAR